jgi:hypothetical protein
LQTPLTRRQPVPLSAATFATKSATDGLMHRSKLGSLVALLTHAVGCRIGPGDAWRAAQWSHCRQPLV